MPLSQEPIVSLTSRTVQPIDEIRKIVYQIPKINAERARLGLEPVIDLSIGQPHIPFPMNILNSFIQYLESLKTMAPERLSQEMEYGHAAGLPETREWISRLFSASYPEIPGGFAPEEVMIANGASGALTNGLKILIEKGDEIATFVPYYAGYTSQIKGCEGNLIAIPFDPTRSKADLLKECLSSHPKIKALIWCDPSNPLGTKAEERELRELRAVIANYPHLIVIHDEIYKDIVHKGSVPSLLNIAPEMKARSFVIRSLAKDMLGAPAIRAGMIAAPIRIQTSEGKIANLIELMSNEQLRDVTSVSILTQKMLIYTIQQKLSGQNQSWENGVRKEYGENVHMMLDALAKIGLHPLAIPNGAFYTMINASPLVGRKDKNGKKIRNDFDVAFLFLHEAGVAVVPGSGFGMDLCSFRISCTKPKNILLQAIERMKQTSIMQQGRF